jgi:ribosomal protein L7Ae-like RNA K-turn-binding protein
LNLLIIAEDASERTKTLYSNQSKKNNIPFIIIGDKITLGSSIGSNFRALVGVKDKKMAENLLKIYARK